MHTYSKAYIITYTTRRWHIGCVPAFQAGQASSILARRSNQHRKTDMTPKVEQMKTGTCGCGRSPTGDCCGWHALTEEEFQAKLAEFQALRELSK